MRVRAALLILSIATLVGCRDQRTVPRQVIIAMDAGGFLDASTPPERDGGVNQPGRDGGMVQPGRDGGPGPTVTLTVQDLQDTQRPAHPGDGASVRVDDVVVTAVFERGGQEGSFYVQDPLGGPFSGILVFVERNGPMPTVVVGDRVSVSGTLIEYFDVTEIVLDTLNSRTAGVPLLPENVQPDALATGSPTAEAYEGVLVRVQNVVVTSDNPDAPDDHGEFEVTGGLRVDDAMFRLDPRPAVGSSIDFVVGVHHHAFENYKLLPRNVDDIGPIF